MMMKYNIKPMLREGINFILIVPLLLVAATVLIINQDMANPTVSAKYGWFGIALLVTILSVFFSFMMNRKVIRISVVDISVTVFCFWGIAHTYYLHDSFSLKLAVFILLWTLYAICRIVLVQRKSYSSILLFALIITGLLEATWGLGQLYGYCPSQHHLFKTTGSFYNSGPYAGYLSVVLPITLYYVLFDYSHIKGKFNFKKIFIYLRWGISLVTFVLILSVLPATMSRASWIAAFVACSFILSVYFIDKYKTQLYALTKNNWKKTLIGSAVVLLLLVGASLGFYHLKKDSADGRAFIWKNTISAIHHHPMGVGVGSFARYYGEEQKNYFASGNASEQEERVAGSPEYAFNEYMQIGMELGVIPLILFLSLLVYTLSGGYKSGNHAAIAGLSALLVFAFMSYPFNLLPFLIVLVLLIVLSIHRKDELKATRLSTAYCLTIVFCALVITSITVYQYYPIHQAYKQWSRVKMLNNMEVDQKQPVEYSKLLDLLGHESRFLFEYAQCLYRLERYDESNQILTKLAKISCDAMLYNVMGRNHQALKEYQQAEEAYKIASLLVPGRLYPYYLSAKLYDETGQEEKALSMARIVLTKKVKVESQAVDEMREEAKEIYDKYKSEE